MARGRSSSCYYSYSILDKEDPEEVKHRKAQFLIYKTLESAASPRRSPCLVLQLGRRVRLRAGRRLARLRKAVHLTFLIVRHRLGLLKRMLCQQAAAQARPPVLPPPLFELAELR